MRIIYIHQYFLTPKEGGATRSYHLAKGLVEQGIEVDMISTHNQAFYDLKIIDGIRVHYLPIPYDQRFGFLKRIWAFYRFTRSAKSWIKKLPRPDYLYITSTPLTTGLIGLWAKRKFALPYIFEVRDLWPDAPIQVGAIRNPLIKKLLYALEKRIYQQAIKIVALSPGIASNIRKKCPQANLHIIPNFADAEIFKKEEKSATLLKKFGLKNTLTISYTGAIGQVNVVDEILKLAHLSKKQKLPFQFLVMGRGSKLPDLLEKAKSQNLENFHLIPFGSKKEVAEVLNQSDVAFISFDQLPILRTNSPNKFFDAIAAGKVILVNHKGWIYDLVKQYEIGFYFHPSNPEEGLKILTKLHENPSKMEKIQQNAKTLSDRFFTKEIAIKKLLMVIYPEKFGGETRDEVYILTA
ncbi:MAG: glycosyltransferase family 4 protein [Cecembia sp.]